jgi:hypothetical protein
VAPAASPNKGLCFALATWFDLFEDEELVKKALAESALGEMKQMSNDVQQQPEATVRVRQSREVDLPVSW